MIFFLSKPGSLCHPAGQETITFLEAPAWGTALISQPGSAGTAAPLALTPGTEVKLLTTGNGFLLLSFKLQGKGPSTENNTNAYVRLKKMTEECIKI